MVDKNIDCETWGGGGGRGGCETNIYSEQLLEETALSLFMTATYPHAASHSYEICQLFIFQLTWRSEEKSLKEGGGQTG